MTDITMTLSSPTVTLVDGKGTLAVSVTNAATTPQRIVLGIYPEGRDAGAPTYALPDRPLRTIPAGRTEQFVVAFDTAGAAPGTYQDKIIPYPADGAPEDAENREVIDLVVPAAAVVPKKGFPWWIAAVAVALVLVIGGVVWFLTRPPGEKELAWAPVGPADATIPVSNMAPDAWYAPFQTKDCEALAAAAPETDPLWAAMSALCSAAVDGEESAWEDAVDGLDAVARPAEEDCLNRAAFDVLKSFVTFHSANASTPIKIVAASGRACPLGLAGLSAANSYAPVSTATGGTAGGTVLRLVGRLEGDVVVKLGATEIPAVEVGESHFEFTTPAAPAQSLIVQVESDGEPVPGAAIFVYTAPSDPDPDGTVTNVCFIHPDICNQYVELEIDPPFIGWDQNFEIPNPGFGF